MCVPNYKVLFLLLNLLYFVRAVSKYQPTIVVSLDGFHYKYLERNITPTLSKLKAEGASAKFIYNVFPTKTFPNHFTIGTGRYPEEHGVLENKVFDKFLNKSLGYSEALFTFNKSIVPIWTLNQKYSADRNTGIMMWPGGEFSYNGTMPKFVQKLNLSDPSLNFKNRVDTVVSWIVDPATPANLVFLYFEEPDGQGHAFGPNSESVNKLLKVDDDSIKYLLQKLEEHNVHDYNLVVLSDHGMANILYSNIVNLSQILPPNSYQTYGSSPTFQLYPKEGMEDDVINKLKVEANKTNSHFKVYKKEEIPDKWRYKNNGRAPPVLLVAENGYVFDDIYSSLEWYHTHMNATYDGPNSTFGAHGYDPEDDNMHPFFFAIGPAFKKSHSVEPFNNVDLYSLFAHLLQLPISENDHSGNFRHVQDMLQPSSSGKATTSLVIGAGIFIVIAFGIIVMSCVCYGSNIKNDWMSNTSYRRRNWNDFEYTALEDYHLLTVLSESDEAM